MKKIMPSKKFKTGDPVKLKSGGPEMTVKNYNEDKYADDELMVDCDWFDKNDTKQSDTFHEDQLEIVSNKPLGIISA